MKEQIRWNELSLDITHEKEWNISCERHYKIRPKSEETWKKQRQKEVNNREETRKRLVTFCRRQQDGSMDSIRQESQLYIVEDNKDANGSMESIRRKEPIICTLHEARIRRELILWSIEDDDNGPHRPSS